MARSAIDERFARYQWVGDNAQQAQTVDCNSGDEWTGYDAPQATHAEAAHLFDYELSAYTEGHLYADGVQRVSIRR